MPFNKVRYFFNFVELFREDDVYTTTILRWREVKGHGD
jgi:hypothetical protein